MRSAIGVGWRISIGVPETGSTQPIGKVFSSYGIYSSAKTKFLIWMFSATFWRNIYYTTFNDF